jgi:cell division septum initiation protein DivIVA
MSKQFVIFACQVLIFEVMLDTVKQGIRQLIAAYEKERMERIRLQTELDESRLQNEACKKQIIELERQIDNLRLTQAFTSSTSGSSPEAKKKIDSLLKEIDRCISLMEG